MSTALLLHGLVPAAAPRPEGAPAHLVVALSGVAVLATPARTLAAPDPAAVTVEDALRRHDRLLAARAAVGDVLPFAFGMTVAGRAGARALIARNLARFRSGLASLSGRAEYLLRCAEARQASSDAAATADHAGDGRAYLGRRVQARRTAAARRSQLETVRATAEAEMAASRGARTLPAAVTDAGVTFAVLLPRRHFGSLIRRLAPVAEDAAPLGLSMMLSGPWPPYRTASLLPGEAAS